MTREEPRFGDVYVHPVTGLTLLVLGVGSDLHPVRTEDGMDAGKDQSILLTLVGPTRRDPGADSEFLWGDPRMWPLHKTAAVSTLNLADLERMNR